MAKSDTDVPRMALSSFCRYDEHTRCTRARANCKCKCHGPGGQQASRSVVAVPDSEASRPNPIERSPMASQPKDASMPPPSTSDGAEPVVAMEKGDPPKLRSRETAAERYAEELATLKADPGEWYRLLDCGSAKAASLLCSGFKRSAEGFEFLSRRGSVWARFVSAAEK